MPKAKAEKKEKPEKKEKKVKDPNAPKKPCGAYMWFCKDKREEVKKEHPGMAVTEIGKRLGELWKAAEEEDKKKYFAQAEKDKERYNKENAAYTKKTGGDAPAPKKAPAKKAAAPKKPASEDEASEHDVESDVDSDD